MYTKASEPVNVSDQAVDIDEGRVPQDDHGVLARIFLEDKYLASRQNVRYIMIISTLGKKKV